MSDNTPNKPDDKATATGAAATTGTPAKAEAKTEAKAKDSTYYLKPGKEHHIIIQGEVVGLKDPNEPVVLTDAAYEAFKDKFDTAAEYKGRIAATEAAAKAAQSEG